MAGHFVQPRRLLLHDMPEQFECLSALRGADPFEQFVENEDVMRFLRLHQDIDDTHRFGMIEVVHHAAHQPWFSCCGSKKRGKNGQNYAHANFVIVIY